MTCILLIDVSVAGIWWITGGREKVLGRSLSGGAVRSDRMSLKLLICVRLLLKAIFLMSFICAFSWAFSWIFFFLAIYFLAAALAFFKRVLRLNVILFCCKSHWSRNAVIRTFSAITRLSMYLIFLNTLADLKTSFLAGLLSCSDQTRHFRSSLQYSSTLYHGYRKSHSITLLVRVPPFFAKAKNKNPR